MCGSVAETRWIPLPRSSSMTWTMCTSDRPSRFEFPNSDHVDPPCVAARQQPVKAGAPRARTGDDIRVFTDNRPAAPRRKLTEFLKLQVEFLSGRTDTTVQATAGELADCFRVKH